MKLSFGVLALLCVQAAWGGDACTTQDVRGTYAFQADGLVLVPGTPITGPFMRIGWFTADGKGSIQAHVLAIYNGINFGQENFSGTYSVSSDCAFDYHAAVPAPINNSDVWFKGQVAENGGDIMFLLYNTKNQNPPPITTIVGHGKRFEHDRCSAEDLLGSWRIELNGVRNLPPFGGGTPYRTVGQIQADGTGGLLASFVTSSVTPTTPFPVLETGAGSYTVSADCTFDLNYSIGSTNYSVRGSLSGRDDAFVGLNMPGPQDPTTGVIFTGAVATGTMAKQRATEDN
jgi:hypothetical protein